MKWMVEGPKPMTEVSRQRNLWTMLVCRRSLRCQGQRTNIYQQKPKFRYNKNVIIIIEW